MYREIGYIPMKDGVRLAYINYRPKKEGSYPVLIIYNVYCGGGIGLGQEEKDYLRHGYAVLGLSARGTGCSGGVFTSPFSPAEGADGKAVVEWAGTQSWCDGNVGMYGNSYSGASQFKVAAHRPKHLKAIAAGGVPGDIYEQVAYPGGIFNFAFVGQWTYFTQPNASAEGARLREALGDTVCRAVRAKRPPTGSAFTEMRSHPLKDAWWAVRNFEDVADRIDVPAMICHGWQDQEVGVSGAVRLFERLKSPKRILLSNGGHGIFDLPAVRAERVRWFNRWLKGERNGADEGPPVTVWFETRGQGGRAKPAWVATFTDWPIPETRWSKLFLTADGKLSRRRPVSKRASGKRCYLYPAGTEVGSDNETFRAPPPRSGP